MTQRVVWTFGADLMTGTGHYQQEGVEVGRADESSSQQGMGVDAAGLRMSQRVVLDKIAPMCHEPYLELE